MQSKQPPSGHRSSRKILVVDDSALLRGLFRDILEMHDFDVDTACNGLEALNYLATHKAPGLVLLDLIMPVMTGMQLLEIVHHDENFRHVPIVVLSSVTDLEAPSLHGYPAIAKPVELDYLVEMSERHFADSAKLCSE